MRIAFFTDTFLPQLNGIVVCITEMAKKLADRGHHIYIIAPKFSKSEQFSYPNVTMLRRRGITSPIYDGYKFTLPFDPWLMKFIIDKKVDIIHFHTPIMLGLQAVLIAKILSIPLVGTFHTFFADPHYLKHIRLSNKVMERLAWGWSNIYYNRCDLVVCPSKGTRAELMAKNCKSPIKVIPHGIDPVVFDNAKAHSVKESYNKNGKLLLFVGRIAHEKNITYLLECFALILKRIPTVKLVIVGSGPQLPDVKAKIKALNISKSVILAGEIEHEKLVKSGIFGACDIFVTASNTETGPLTVLEAQANGLVCIGVRGKGMGLIKSNVNGYVVKLGDREGFANAVVTLLNDKERYIRMREATLREIKKYELSHTVDMFEKAYKEVSLRK